MDPEQTYDRDVCEDDYMDFVIGSLVLVLVAMATFL